MTRNISHIERTLILLVITAVSSLTAYAQDFVIKQNSNISISVNLKEAPVVQTAFGMLKADINTVFGSNLLMASSSDGADIIVSKKDNDKPETFSMRVERGKLYIEGSDARGVAYGMLELSKMIGVSPWEWWADVTPTKMKTFKLKNGYNNTESPSVRYRGIFINDEDWGLKTWSSLNYEKQLGDIGPKTYAKVCELLLRLKGNMLAPAMHSCTGAFYTHPESKVIANQYGIMITTSHCEPLLFNNASKAEWDSNRDGEWNYRKNKDVILGKLDSRVKEASPYDNIYTMGMRGVHDAGLTGNFTPQERVQVITDVINDERGVLEKYLLSNEHHPEIKAIEDVPQIYVPYKEALDIYENGLKVPDDITLVWPDDNYGYMKRLSNDEEQKRSGHSGVYYHISYLGAPHDYLWLCTTPPMLMYEELTKAYATGGDRYWLLNVGDIKPAELDIQTFFDMAWNLNQFSYDNINNHQSHFLANIFGKKYEKVFQDILDTHYQLAWSRKPEFMGWEREWDSKEYTGLKDTEYSFENYNQAQQRIAEYNRISTLCHELLGKMPEEKKAAFYELLAYPVMAACQMNMKFLYAQLNHQMESEWAAKCSVAAYDSINALTDRYNTMLDGKWNHMMALAPGWCALYQKMPELTKANTSDTETTDINEIPQSKYPQMEGCQMIDLTKPSYKDDRVRILRGIGYDWNAIQLGEAADKTMQDSGAKIQYKFPGTGAEKVTIHIWTVPFFPIYKGHSNRFAVQVDNNNTVVAENQFNEFQLSWKDQVLQNGHKTTATFHIDSYTKTHTLTLSCIDPGQIIQRVIIDWGGLKQTYCY